MSGSPDDLHAAAAWFDLLAAWHRDRDAGRDATLADYQRRFPELTVELARRWPALDTDGHALATDDHFGPYRILHELGQGGQGAVFAAVDTRLGRRVALKLLTPLVGAGSTARLERFRREARIVASLDHPGIAKVFEADVRDGVPFLAMQLVGGETLARLLQARRDRGEPPHQRAAIDATLGWIEAAARALHVAHEAGVVHRDIKPANLRIDERGAPVLLDFGLARATGPDSDRLTGSGAVPGTLAYMAPELLDDAADAAAPDRRADVYALGVTLFECLTLRLPFRNADRAGLADAIRSGDLLDPRRANRAVPRDVAAIVATATARDPQARYATAAGFADDLARARGGEPVRARPVPWTERAVRRLRRHPTATVAALSLFAVFALMACSLLVLDTRERVASALHRSRTAAFGEAEATAALRDLVDAMDRAPDASLRSALLEVLTHVNRAWDRPRDRPPHDSGAVDPAVSADGERVAIAVGGDGRVEIVAARRGTTLAVGAPAAARIIGLGFAADGALWLGTADGTVLAVDADDLALRHRAQVVARGCGFALAPDRRSLAVGGDGGVALLDCDTAAVPRAVSLPGAGAVRTLRFAPDGRRLLALSQRSTHDVDAADVAHVVDVATGAVLGGFEAAAQPVIATAWSADGAHLAIGGNAGGVEIRRADTSAPRTLCDVGEQVHWLGFAPGSGHLLVPDERSTAVWDWRAVPPRIVARFDNAPQRTWGAAGFSPDGHRLAAVHRDGTVAIFAADGAVQRGPAQRAAGADGELANGAVAERAMTDNAPADSAPADSALADSALSDRALADSAAANGAAVRAAAPERALRIYKHHVVAVRHLEWLPGADLLLTADLDRVTAWHAAVRPHAPAFAAHAGAVLAIATRPDRDEWATAGADRRVAVWAGSSAAPRVTIDGDPAVDGLAYTPDGRLLIGWTAGGSSAGAVRVWRADDGSPVASFVPGGRTRALVAAGDGAHAITAGDDGRIRVWSLATGAQVAAFAHGDAPVLTLALDPSGRRLAAGGADRRLTLWDWRRGAPLGAHLLSDSDTDWRAHPIHQVRAVAFASDGAHVHASLVNNKLVTVATDPTAAGETEIEIEIDRFGGPMQLAASDRAGGRPERLLCADYSFGRLSLVEAGRQRPLGDGGPAHGNRITAVIVAPDGRLGASAGSDGLLRLWDLDHARLHAEVRTGAPILAAAFDHTGAWIVTGTADGRVSRWPVDPLPLARRILGGTR